MVALSVSKTSASKKKHPATLPLSLAALGIVFGDLGTSPLYALQNAFDKSYGVVPSQQNIIGIVSLFLWSLILMVNLKYVTILMRADNRGEGGILALLALLLRKTTVRQTKLWVIVALIGVAMLYGDGIITPAISVLSAIDGLNVATRSFEPYIISISIIILVGIFFIQSFGSGRVGFWFGPILAIWFIALALLGVNAISQCPKILSALNPYYAIAYFYHNGLRAFYSLGAVVLCLTGAEALYADMGHFGRPAIKLAWNGLALPALVLNYLGQGALLLTSPEVVTYPFYAMVPHWALYPMIVLATLATIVASQALISAVFSLTAQAVQLGFSPRVQVQHTSKNVYGQIYLPALNWWLMIATIALVIIFRSASNLANAYGFAVSVTMSITTILFIFLVRYSWKWSWVSLLSVFGFFVIIDSDFVLANLTKFLEGAWIPFVLAAAVFMIMYAWYYSNSLLKHKAHEISLSLKEFLDSLNNSSLLRIPGTAIFMAEHSTGVPRSLLHHLKHNQVLHEQVVILTITLKKVPYVSDRSRVKIVPFSHGFSRIIASFGFMEAPNVPAILENTEKYHNHQPWDMMTTSFYLGKQTFVAELPHPRLENILLRLFIWFKRNENCAVQSFHLPHNRVIEMGGYIEL